MNNVDVNLGKACNNRCIFCSNGAPSAEERRWARVADVEAEITRRRSEGAGSIGFLGGEPTLYPQLERIVSLARQLGFQRIYLCTNGSRLADPDRLARLLDAGVTRLAVSIHSHTARLEDAITRRRGSFAEKLRALELLVAEQQRGRLVDGLSLNTVLHAKNLVQLDAFASFMHRLGICDIRFNFIRPSGKVEGSRAWVPTFAQTTPLVARLVARNELEFGLHLNFADFPLCKLPWPVLSSPILRRRYVGEDWDLRTDVTQMQRSDGPVEDQGVARRFNWRDRRMEFKSFLQGCERCVLRTRCEGVWDGYLKLHGGTEFLAGPAVAEACLSAG